jgi:hypothetical protein
MYFCFDVFLFSGISKKSVDRTIGIGKLISS